MAQHNDLGKFGEEQASKYLIEQGYQILARNYRFRKAEIDIIAQKDSFLTVVEVKTRKNSDFGEPESFVNPKKMKLLISAANEFVCTQDIDAEVRFDIISITIEPQLHIEHIEDAYYFF